MAEKIDLVRDNRDEYAMPREPLIVRVRAGRYLTVSGKGGPHDEEFQRTLGELYALAYTVKFEEKARGRDFKVGVRRPRRTGTGSS